MKNGVIRTISFLLLSYFAASMGIAAECETYRPHEVRSNNPRRCECGNVLEKVKIKVPSGFKLYTVCDLYFEEATPITLRGSNTTFSESLSGSFYFIGDSVISGVIKKGDEINRGNLYFYPNQDAARPSYREIGFEDSSADRRFGTETLAAGWAEQHWCAPATIRIKRMYLYEWSSEASGAYALDYDVLKVGKFRRCSHS